MTLLRPRGSSYGRGRGPIPGNPTIFALVLSLDHQAGRMGGARWQWRQIGVMFQLLTHVDGRAAVSPAGTRFGSHPRAAMGRWAGHSIPRRRDLLLAILCIKRSILPALRCGGLACHALKRLSGLWVPGTRLDLSSSHFVKVPVSRTVPSKMCGGGDF